MNFELHDEYQNFVTIVTIHCFRAIPKMGLTQGCFAIKLYLNVQIKCWDKCSQTLNFYNQFQQTLHGNTKFSQTLNSTNTKFLT